MVHTGWLTVLLCAGSVAADRPAFEVASIKLCRPSEYPGTVRKAMKTGRGGGGGRVSGSPGRLAAECRSVASLIVDAYEGYADGKPWPTSATTGLPNPPRSQRLLNLLGENIKGAPGWVNSERYTIEAKAPGPQSTETMRGPMMQALLEERFRLKIHREAGAYPVYELTVLKGGPKLEAARPGSCIKIDLEHLPQPPAPGQPPRPPMCGAVRVSADREHIDMSGVTMGDFCNQFSATLDREVVDKTGLAGVFDVKIMAPPEDLGFAPRDRDPSGPFVRPGPDTMFVALRGALQKVGLKLEAAKGSAEFLVIDSIQRPSEN